MDVTLDPYKGYVITVDASNGQFSSVVDGDGIAAATLVELKAQIDRIEVATLDAARKAQKPVKALVLLNERGEKALFQAVTVLGVHAGRTSRKAIRVLANGQKNSLDLGYHNSSVTVLHPDDPRAAIIKAHLQAISVAQINLAAAEASFRDYKAALPRVSVPEIESKEDAVREEPAFLAAIETAITAALVEHKEASA